MSTTRRWGRALAAVLVAAASMTLAVRAQAAPSDDGFRIVEHTTYRLDPAGSAVHVQIVTELTNQSPSTRSGNYIRSLYLPAYAVPILSESVNVAAVKDDGTPLPVTMEPVETPRFLMAQIDLQPDLFYPDTDTVTLSYDIPSVPPRSDSVSRVNPAYALFPVQAFGDPGLSDVEVIVPDGFEVETTPNKLTKEDRGAEDAYVAHAIADPATFFAIVSARNDDALVDRDVATDDVDATVQAWPGDEQWGDFVADHLKRGLPILEDLIGQPWKGDNTLDVVETASPYIYGYSGWYMRTKSLIEIGDALEPVVILHELSHVWFNDQLFSARWINEALAEEYGREAAQRLGESVPPLLPIDPADPGAQPLNAWSNPVLDESISDAQEVFGYNASVNVMDQIRHEIGFEGLAKVIEAAFDRTLTYRGDPEPEQAVGTAGWQRFLDLLDEVGGSKQADGIFSTYVLGPDDVAKMAARDTARTSYAQLKDRGAGWSPPRVLREALGEWNFGAVSDLITTSGQILDIRDEIAHTLQPARLAVPKGLEDAYETAASSSGLEDVVARANDLLAAAKDVAAAKAVVGGSRGPLEKVGLLFSDADTTMQAAERALDDGDAAAATAKAGKARREVDDAQTAGLVRVIAVLVLVGSGVGTRQALRRRRRRRPVPDPEVL